MLYALHFLAYYFRYLTGKQKKQKVSGSNYPTEALSWAFGANLVTRLMLILGPNKIKCNNQYRVNEAVSLFVAQSWSWDNQTPVKNIYLSVETSFIKHFNYSYFFKFFFRKLQLCKNNHRYLMRCLCDNEYFLVLLKVTTKQEHPWSMEHYGSNTINI